jgi:hypothetical protein
VQFTTLRSECESPWANRAKINTIVNGQAGFACSLAEVEKRLKRSRTTVQGIGRIWQPQARTQGTKRLIRDIKLIAHRKFTTEDTIRMALEGFRLDTPIRDLRRREASRRLPPGLDNHLEDSRQETVVTGYPSTGGRQPAASNPQCLPHLYRISTVSLIPSP